MREIEASVPEWFEKIVKRLHSKSPADRPSSASEVAELLRECLAHVQQPTVTSLPGSLTAPSKSDTGNRRPANRKLIAAAAFAFSLIFAGVLIVLELDKGTLTIECAADNVPIRIMQGQEIVKQLSVNQTGRTVRIAAGTYDVVIDGKSDGMTVEGGRVSLRRGDKEIAKIVYSDGRVADSSTVSTETGITEAVGADSDSDFARRRYDVVIGGKSDGMTVEGGRFGDKITVDICGGRVVMAQMNTEGPNKNKHVRLVQDLNAIDGVIVNTHESGLGNEIFVVTVRDPSMIGEKAIQIGEKSVQRKTAINSALRNAGIEEVHWYEAPRSHKAKTASDRPSRIPGYVQVTPFSQTEQARQRAEKAYGSQLPQFKETLMSGSSEERLEALQTILAQRIALIMDDSFVAAFSKCAEDKDPRVRVQSTIIAGGKWVWEAEDQNPDAIQLMLKLSKDDHRNVRYNAVYYGLSTVRNKSDDVIRRLLEMAFEDREWNLFHRIEWGLRDDHDRVVTLLTEYIDGDNSVHAKAAQEVFKQLAGSDPPPIHRTETPSDPAHTISGFVMEFRSGTPDVPVCLCDAATGLPVAKDTYKPVDWSKAPNGSWALEMAIVISDEKGNFRFDNVPDGKYRLIAQKWMGPYKGVFELHGAEIRLMGAIDEITVPRPADEQAARVVPVPMGENTIQFNQDVANNETFLFLSTAPPEFDPILGLQGLGTAFWKNLIGVNRMPLGKTTVIGAPNKPVYAFLFAADNSPGFATITVPPPESGSVRLPAEPFVAGWSNGRKTPPPKLAELMEFMKTHELTTQQLLDIPELSNANFKAYQARMQELTNDLSRVIELPSGESARVGDLLAADAYRKLQK